VGNVILPPKPPSLPRIQSPRILIFIWLALCSIMSTVAFLMTTEYFRLIVSRRFVLPVFDVN
jgi:hypothetical protein